MDTKKIYIAITCKIWFYHWLWRNEEWPGGEKSIPLWLWIIFVVVVSNPFSSCLTKKEDHLCFHPSLTGEINFLVSLFLLAKKNSHESFWGPAIYRVIKFGSCWTSTFRPFIRCSLLLRPSIFQKGTTTASEIRNGGWQKRSEICE